MNNSIKLLDIVALIGDFPQYNLYRGQVGTVVEILDLDVYEVEFIDDGGQNYAIHALNVSQLMVLHYEFIKAA